MTPGSCTTGIHILLEELELIFQVQLVNLLNDDHKTDEYMTINPKSSIPMLVTDEGKVITEFPAIAYWLARAYPKANLLSDNLDDEVRIMEVMEYVVGTIHMQGFARIFTTEKFTPHEADFDWVRQQGKDIIEQGFNVINGLLEGHTYVVENFSIADAALFYVEFWADRTAIPFPENCLRHFESMLQRFKVKQVLMEEGYTI
ncbi:MAG: glutathione S-transferase family protein [Gammaproteobacteria bacterium]